MQNNHIVIKDQQKDWLLKGFIYLALMILSLAITFIPLFTEIESGKLIFYIAGGLAFTTFTTLFAILLYKVSNPGIALILNAHGFIDKKNVGDRIVIEWTNISAIKQLGKKDMPYLAISLENEDAILAQMKSKEADAMRENLNNNLPAILIAQNEIRMPIKELKEIFTKYAREARTLASENENVKEKVNPYDSNDVLKTFVADIGKTEADNADTTPVAEEVATDIVESPAYQETQPITEPAQPIISNNFYEELLKQAETEVATETDNNLEVTQTPNIEFQIQENVENTTQAPVSLTDIFDKPENDTNKDNTIVISQEFTDILNHARATKVLELDKILNSKEIDSISDQSTPSEISKETSPLANDADKPRSEIKISDLESMIEDALQNAEPKRENKISDSTPIITIDIEETPNEPIDAKIGLPIDINENSPKAKKKKTLVLTEKK